MSPHLSIVLATGLGFALAPIVLAPAQEPAAKKIEDRRPPPPPEPAKVMIAPAVKVAGPGAVPSKPAAAPSPPAPATSPTTVTLDFKGQTVSEVVRTLGERSGGQVELFNLNDPRWNQQRVMLEASAPVPLWDAVDRLSAATAIQHTVTWAGPVGNHRPRIQFQANYGYALSGSTMAIDDGLAAYVGPFRLGPVVIHEHFERVFLRSKSAAAINETPPFYADIPLIAEPTIVWVQTGPLRGLEAIDDAGQSLLDPKLGGELSQSSSSVEAHGPPKNLRVPLVRAPKPSKVLATLRGMLPLEIGRRPPSPTKVIPLAGTPGQIFRDGDLAINVREYKVDGEGKAIIKLSVRIDGRRGEPDPKQKQLLNARLWSIYYHQLELADSQGKPVILKGGSSPNSEGNLNLDYTYTPTPPGSKSYPPTQVRIYRPDWVAWDLPIVFRDLPLP